jgi:hypothetical protein
MQLLWLISNTLTMIQRQLLTNFIAQTMTNVNKSFTGSVCWRAAGMLLKLVLHRNVNKLLCGHSKLWIDSFGNIDLLTHNSPGGIFCPFHKLLYI